MKLRTFIDHGELHYSPSNLYHDAMFAHALVMTISELQTMSDMLVTIRIRKRAAELMHEWGYTED